MQFCSKCGTRLPDSARFCASCGAQIQSAPNTPTAPNPPQQSQSSPSQRPLNPTYQKTASPANPPKAAPKKKKGKAIIAVISIILILAILTVAGAFAYKIFFASESSGNSNEITVEQFLFRQTAFECGSGATKTQVLAVIDKSVNTEGLSFYAYCSETDEKITMTDDGKGADIIAGDNVFYGMAEFVPDEEKSLTFTLKASDEKYTLTKVEATVVFYTEYTYDRIAETLADINDDIDRIASDYIPELSGDGTETAENYLETVAQIEEYLRECIENGDILSYEFSSPYFIINTELQSFTYILPTGDDIKAGNGSAGAYNEAILANADQKMLLMLPCDGELDSGAFQMAMNYVSDADVGFESASVLTGSSVNVSAMKRLQSYRVIVINTHGGNSQTYGPFFRIGISYYDAPYDDCANKRIIPSSDGNALVTAAFFEYYYEDKSLNDCLIYLGCCHGADDDLLADTLIRKGADAVLAYTNGVYSTYDQNMVKGVLSSLTQSDPDSAGLTQTLTYAVNEAKNKYGVVDPTVTEWYNFWKKVQKEEKRAEMIVYQDNDGEEFRLVNNSYSGTISGNVVTADDRSVPVPYARVEIENESGDFYKAFFTNTNGEYSVSLPAGNYTVTVTADGYCKLVLYTNVYVNYTTYLETMLLVENDEDATGIAKGVVTSALTGRGLSGVSLTVRQGWSNIDKGDVVATTTTDSDGSYSLSLPVGNYTVVAELDEYIPASFNIVVQKGITSDQNGSMSMDLDGEDFRIVLTWGENPRDLDIHIVGPTEDNDEFHVYFSDMNYIENDTTICKLDVDDTTSYGPETITLLTLQDNPYYCFIHHYSGYGTLTTSSASVQVYSGSQLVASFAVPNIESDGVIWNIFAIVDGQIVVRNTITDSPELTYAD